MKRILILTITVLAFFITSCNQTHCWNCTITYKNSVLYMKDGKPGSGVVIQPVCGKTKKEIKQYATENTKKDDVNNSSVEYICNKDYYK